MATKSTKNDVEIGRMGEEIHSMSTNQDEMKIDVKALLAKLDEHAQADNHAHAETLALLNNQGRDLDVHKQEYKTDKRWAVGILGMVWALVLAWVEYRAK
jgi:hypothetical protein